MKPINYANSFGVSILGVRLPKYTVYGEIKNRDGSKSLTYYVTDLNQFTDWQKNTVDIYICRYKSQFRKERFSLNSGLGQMVVNFVFDNHLETKRVEYAYSTQMKAVVPRERKPQKFMQRSSEYLQKRDSAGINEEVKPRKDFIRVNPPENTKPVKNSCYQLHVMEWMAATQERSTRNRKKSSIPVSGV